MESILALFRWLRNKLRRGTTEQAQAMTLAVGKLGTGAFLFVGLADGRELILMLPRTSAVALADKLIDAVEVPGEKDDGDDPETLQ